MQGSPVDLQQRIAELEQRVREQDRIIQGQRQTLDAAFDTINLQSQIIKTIKDDGSDDLTFLVDNPDKNPVKASG